MLMNWVVSVMYWLVFHYPQPQCLICMWTCISVKLIFCLLFAGSLNPLCVLQLDDPPQKLSTSVLQNTASPAWDQPFILWVQLQCCQKQSLQTPVYRENKNEFVACELNRLVNTCHRLRDIQPTVLLSPPSLCHPSDCIVAYWWVWTLLPLCGCLWLCSLSPPAHLRLTEDILRACSILGRHTQT